jgi:hypothetical protein
MHNLDDLERQFEQGDKRALATALMLFVVNNKEAPFWLRMAWLNGCANIQKARVTSWDDVLGKPHNGKHLPDAKRRAELRVPVWYRIRCLNQGDGLAIGDELFAWVADEFDISESLAKKLFYEVQRKGGKTANVFRPHKRKPKQRK